MTEFEWHYSNTRIDFPFVAVQPPHIKKAFADAVITDGSDRDELVMLESLHVDLTQATIGVVYQNTLDNFFSQPPVSRVVQFGQWVLVQFDEAVSNKHIAIVLDGNEVTLPYTLYGLTSVFQAHCVDRLPATVRRIFVEDEYGTQYVLQGAIDLVAGYNMRIDVEDPQEMFSIGERQTWPLRFNAIPGAGMGKVPNDCVGDGKLRAINGIGPDAHGNFRLVAGNCYRIWRPAQSYTPSTVILEPNMLQMANGCTPCCYCEDFGNVYCAMQRIYNIGEDIGGAMELSGGAINDTNDAFDIERVKRASNRMKVLLKPSQGLVLGIQITFENNQPGQGVALWTDHTIITIAAYGCSLDCTFPNCRLIDETIYIFNEQFQDWRNIEDPLDAFTDAKPDTMDLSPSTSGDNYGYLRGTSFATVYFELRWDEAEAGDEVSVTVSNSSFGTSVVTTAKLLKVLN